VKVSLCPHSPPLICPPFRWSKPEAPGRQFANSDVNWRHSWGGGNIVTLGSSLRGCSMSWGSGFRQPYVSPRCFSSPIATAGLSPGHPNPCKARSTVPGYQDIWRFMRPVVMLRICLVKWSITAIWVTTIRLRPRFELILSYPIFRPSCMPPS